MTPKQLLGQMVVPGDPTTFVLGSFDIRVTIYAQQVRALNLAYSLLDAGRLEGKKIGIVGGGISGLTVAAAALHFGASVTIFERAEELVPIQRLSERWVHPHIYDWPSPEAGRPDAHLPFLSWSAGTASQVTGVILAGWNVIRNKHRKNLQERTSTEVTEVGDGRINGSRDNRRVQGRFDSIVLAVGFGRERNSWKTPSYWEGDDFAKARSARTSFLVSGCGDGGLCDVLRIALRDSNLRDIVRRLEAPRFETLRREVLRVELEANTQLEAGDADAVVARFYDLLGDTAEEQRREVLGPLRPQTEVVLNGKGLSPYSHGASALNRTLVALLSPPYIRGEVVARLEGNRYEVVSPSGTRIFDRVVQRHGPGSVLQERFGAIHASCFERMTGYARLDLTRERMFPPEWGQQVRPPIPLLDRRPLSSALGSPFLISEAALGLDRLDLWRGVQQACKLNDSALLLLMGTTRQSLAVFFYRLYHVLTSSAEMRHDVRFIHRGELPAITGVEWLLNMRTSLDGGDGWSLEQAFAELTAYGPLLLVVGDEPFRSLSSDEIHGLRELIERDLPNLLAGLSLRNPVRVVIAIEYHDEGDPTRSLNGVNARPPLERVEVPEARFPLRSDVEAYCRLKKLDSAATKRALEEFNSIERAAEENDFEHLVMALDTITQAGNER